MFYEPDRRLSVDREQTGGPRDPLDAPPPEERGQFWNVNRTVYGAALGAGLASGWWFGVVDPFDLEELVDQFTGTSWAFPLGCILGGAIVALIGASLRRRAKSED
ncbi:MAG TPA: hypothetical protein VG742_01390 [Dongiaceae bacterium]|nr:hypothetical protein [Dongiaceae bacterium]